MNHDPMIYIIVVPLVAIIGGLIWLVRWDRKREGRRCAALRHHALERDLPFSGASVKEIEEWFPNLHFLGFGRWRRYFNVFSARKGERPFWVFDFQSVSGTGNSATKIFISACIMKPDYPLRHLAIYTEKAKHRVAAVYGGGDINFESEEFSRRFCVVAKDRRWAHAAITPRTMEVLLEHPPENLVFQPVDGVLVIIEHGILNPARVDRMLKAASTVLDEIPPFLRAEETEE